MAFQGGFELHISSMYHPTKDSGNHYFISHLRVLHSSVQIALSATLH